MTTCSRAASRQSLFGVRIGFATGCQVLAGAGGLDEARDLGMRRVEGDLRSPVDWRLVFEVSARLAADRDFGFRFVAGTDASVTPGIFSPV